MITRLLLVDDHELMRSALRALLEKLLPTIQIVGEAGDGRAAVRLARELQPDAIIMDLVMPGLNGIEATRQIIAASPLTKILVLSGHDDMHFVEAALQAGAVAYLLKQSPAAELAAGLTAAMDHKSYISPRVAGLVVGNYVRRTRALSASAAPVNAFTLLTPREREVLQLVSEGRTSKEIGSALHIGLKTVETHRGQIMTRLNIRSIAGLTKYAVREGITSL